MGHGRATSASGSAERSRACIVSSFEAWRRQYDGSRVQGGKVFHPLHRDAILRLCHLDSPDLLFVSHKNTVGGLLPYLLARDAAHRAIVLSIRGNETLASLDVAVPARTRFEAQPCAAANTHLLGMQVD